MQFSNGELDKLEFVVGISTVNIKLVNGKKEQIQQLVAECEKELEKIKCRFYIDNELYSISTIRKWQKKELIKTGKLLNRIFGTNIRLDSGMTFDEIKSIILTNKIAIGQDQLKEGLKHQIKMGQIVSQLCAFLSHGRHRVSIADIYLEDSKYDAAEVMGRFVEMMTVNNIENQILNFKANPNHFYSSGSNTTQEVVEMTGGTRFANRFFLKYGDDSGLSTKKDKSFSVEAAGIGFLEDGTLIGGVRHEMVSEEKTLHVRLQVEFPAITPMYMIHQHSIHLLVEFSNWLTDIQTEQR